MLKFRFGLVIILITVFIIPMQASAIPPFLNQDSTQILRSTAGFGEVHECFLTNVTDTELTNVNVYIMDIDSVDLLAHLQEWVYTECAPRHDVLIG